VDRGRGIIEGEGRGGLEKGEGTLRRGSLN